MKLFWHLRPGFKDTPVNLVKLDLSKLFELQVLVVESEQELLHLIKQMLLGLGIRSFSMNASAIPRVKQAVRGLDIGDCARFARRVMEQSDPARIRELVAGFAAGTG